MMPYLKGMHQTIDGWKPSMNSDGWKYTPRELVVVSKYEAKGSDTYNKELVMEIAMVKDGPTYVVFNDQA